jgi:hypothetical protein
MFFIGTAVWISLKYNYFSLLYKILFDHSTFQMLSQFTFIILAHTVCGSFISFFMICSYIFPVVVFSHFGRSKAILSFLQNCKIVSHTPSMPIT